MKKNNRLCFRHFKRFSPLPKQALWVSILFLLLGVCAPVYGQGFQYITAPEVKSMIEKDPRAVLINVLSTIEYDGLHITGSINIPITTFRASTLLPKNMDTPIITYCMGKI